MISISQIEAYTKQIASEFRPERIILFGSYAYGQPTEDSDVDLLVVMNHKGRSVEQAIKIRQKLDAPFPMDLMVRSPRKISQRLEMQDCFIREILNKGRVLYESRNKRMGLKGRG